MFPACDQKRAWPEEVNGTGRRGDQPTAPLSRFLFSLSSHGFRFGGTVLVSSIVSADVRRTHLLDPRTIDTSHASTNAGQESLFFFVHESRLFLCRECEPNHSWSQSLKISAPDKHCYFSPSTLYNYLTNFFVLINTKILRKIVAAKSGTVLLRYSTSSLHLFRDMFDCIYSGFTGLIRSPHDFNFVFI